MNLDLLYREHIAELCVRHARALDNSGYDQLLIHAGAPGTAFMDDNDYPFRVNPHFKHWLPLLEHPYSVLVVAAGERPRLIYFQPEDYWHKPPEDPEGSWVEHFDVVLAKSKQDIVAALPSRLERTAYIGEQPQLLGDFAAAQVNPPRLIAELHFQRAYKTEYEIACLGCANVIAARGHKAARAAFLAGGTELDIHHAYLRGAGVLESELPYANIVAVNNHSSILHYHGADRSPMLPQDIHSLVIDAGAQFRGYASDITRSYAFHKGEYAELVQAVDQEQLALVDEIQIGMDFAELHWRGHLRMAHLLSRFELVRLEAADIVELGISRAFFPCGLGHFIGLQVHDVGGYLKAPDGEEFARDPKAPFLRLVRKVEPRQAFTVEPGIYFSDMLLEELARSDNSRHINWQKVNEFRGYGGVRVEDCVVVHDSGVENQSRDAFRALAGDGAR
ncbi:Xaa-Pro dipeptidase Metallo peptidase. MEROPS family M24B [Microbulbifer donghaiensis]|uniref:Xaa-Pro dipeptidase n=1 Tax=Microbulbifer donghaiensis TaxID=494016 RepID=A0A1M4UDB0_9GAMM|nr:Xaa-Pro dipeptidase [Microbulbifer donghaiensis]SHE54563.1 Xaa-Pro dipeptidase Metallo peptidase. MEROPS family M24B [Microbulbifer donghaiensis]